MENYLCKVMNPFLLLFLSKEEVIQIVAKQQDQTRICSSYILKMDLTLDNPPIFKSKVYFLKVRKSIHINPELSIQIPPLISTRDPESIYSSQRMFIIDDTPNHYTILDSSNSKNLRTHFESFDSDEIPKLDRIPPYARSIQ